MAACVTQVRRQGERPDVLVGAAAVEEVVDWAFTTETANRATRN